MNKIKNRNTIEKMNKIELLDNGIMNKFYSLASVTVTI